jgi:3-oxoacyl-(acyl-carrier-protein) synthase
MPYALPPEFGAPACLAHTCDPAPAKGLFPPNRLRRLGRAQVLALASAVLAAQDCTHPLPFGDRSAVVVGSGLGEQDETTEFLRGMFASNEAELRPARFVNSVHNSMASQIAIHFGARGENNTFTHGDISFELALESGLRSIRTGRADTVVVCGVDVLTPHTVAVGCVLGCWRTGADPMTGAPLAGTTGGLPGEGAASLLLARPDVVPEAARVAHIAAIAVEALDAPISHMDPAEVTRFIIDTLASANVPAKDVSLAILGCNSDPELDENYHKFEQALSAALGFHAPIGMYKSHCGDFRTASALGVFLAIDVVRKGRLPDAVTCPCPPRPGGSSGAVLVCSMSLPRHLSLCVVTA